MLCFGLSFGQNKTVSGNVTDQSGLPLIGVNIVVRGTANGTQTDFDGNYTLQVNEGDVLSFSYVGLKTAEVTVGTSNTINLIMEEDAQSLDEVVVVAYGTQTKEALVGSVVALSAGDIGNQQVTSPLRALQGAVPGVSLITSGGQPGNNPEIRIRGFSSVNAEQGPLIILDGAQYNGNINAISQDQIESLTVLKDASSTSLYGSRGANGVVVITTKKGTLNSGAKVTFRTQYGLSNPAVGLHDLVGTEDIMKLSWQAIRNNNLYALGQSPADAALNATNSLIPSFGYNPYNVANPIDIDGNLVSGASLLWETDWEEELIRRNVSRTNHTLSVSGGGEKSTYFFSLDYLNDEGPVLTSDFERISTRLNLSTQVNDWLKVGGNLSFSRSSSNQPDQDSGSTVQTNFWIYGVSSVYPIYARDEFGNLVFDSGGDIFFDAGNGNGGRIGQPLNANRSNVNGGENILASILLGSEKRIRTNFIGNGFAEVKFLKDFTFKSTFSFENYVFDSHSFDDDEIGIASGVDGRVSKDRDVTTTLNAIQALNYKKTFGNHNISIDAITEAYTLTLDTFRASATGLLPGQEEIGNAANPETSGGIRISRRINGYLGRAAYNYNNKYFVEGSFRTDGSSQFGEDFRWGDFFSVGGSWIVSKEKFMENIGAIDYLKLRASYGELGNNGGIGSFPYQFTFVSANASNIVLGSNEGNPTLLSPVVLPDPTLKWETTASTNFGVDFNIFNGKFRGSVDYYEKESIDLLLEVPAANSTGITDIFTNFGALKNFGWEFALNSQVFDNSDFSWDLGVNFSLDKNEWTKLPQEQVITGTKIWKEGSSLFDFYMREWAGVDPATGDALWYIDVTDANGNVTGRDVTNVYDQATQYETGKSSLPDIQGGISSNLRYKQFDLNVLFNFSKGAYLYDTDYSGLISPFQNLGTGVHPDNFLAWQQPGDITNFPRLTTQNNNFTSRSTRFLFENDYLRLKSLTIGYNLSKEVLDRIGLSSFRIYLQGDNLITWQSHKGIDPEQAFNGLTSGRSPLQRTITGGFVVEL
jgi:TonB-linked SusC/RagA family outer membrane protein